jgi:hypothetical protein
MVGLNFRLSLVGLLLGTLTVSCGLVKAPACKADSDCKIGANAGYCVESKCVECRKDDDCKLPKMCDQDHTCFDLH